MTFKIIIIVIFSSSACGPVSHSLKASGTKASLDMQGKLRICLELHRYVESSGWFSFTSSTSQGTSPLSRLRPG